jgi:hypothetical protein
MVWREPPPLDFGKPLNRQTQHFAVLASEERFLKAVGRVHRPVLNRFVRQL